jgi:ABC-type nitrate/sulfonate/bicarbonate transport system permease component
VLVCFFPICVNTFTGLKGVEPEMINLLKVMGASKFTIFREVSLPFAMPQIFSGLKIAATYSIMGAVIGEWLGAKSGLGIYMTLVGRSFETSKLFAAIIVIVLLSLFIYRITELLTYVLMPWTRHKFKEDLF